MEFETFIGFVGLVIFICALLDVDWFMRMTRSARRGYEYPFTRKFTRIMWGAGGLFAMLIGFT
jgi:hypothetical protein